MIGWHHHLSGHEVEQAPGDGEGQGSLVCCSPWDHKESDMTERMTGTSSSALDAPQNHPGSFSNASVFGSYPLEILI